MKSNDNKCHLIVANQENISVTLGQEIIEASDSVVLLGINIDKKLHFNEHISTLLKKAIRNYMPWQEFQNISAKIN